MSGLTVSACWQNGRHFFAFSRVSEQDGKQVLNDQYIYTKTSRLFAIDF